MSGAVAAPFGDLYMSGGVERGAPVLTAAGIALHDRVLAHLHERARTPSMPLLRAPSVINRHVLERTGYLVAHPHLLGVVGAVAPSRRAHLRVLQSVLSGEDWSTGLHGTGMVLPVAACHFVYDALADSAVSESVVEVTAPCFRLEHAVDGMRRKAFTMLEYVVLGTTERAATFATESVARATSWLGELGLDVDVVSADDSFMGTGGSEAAAPERKLELCWRGDGTALASVNFHGAHFAAAFGIRNDEGHATTACLAFGIDRIVTAVHSIGGAP